MLLFGVLSGFCFVLATAKESQIDFVWDLSRTELLTYRTEKYIQSPKFKTSNVSREESWYLRVYPKGADSNSADYLSMYLCHDGRIGVSTKATIFVENQDKSENPSYEMSLTFTGDEACWGYDKFTKRATLFDSQKTFAKGSKIRVGVRIKTDPFVLFNDSRTTCSDESAKSKLNSFRIEGAFTDIVLKSAYDTWVAHKVILAMHSRVFDEMFRSSLAVHNNGQESAFEIISFECIAVEQMLEFMYTNAVSDINDESARHLVQCAHNFEIEGLKRLCENYFRKEMSCENAIELLVLSADLDLEKLRNQSMYFILDDPNHCDLMEHDKWEILKQSPKLMAALTELTMITSRIHPNRIIDSEYDESYEYHDEFAK